LPHILFLSIIKLFITAILAIRYNEQLDNTQKQDVWQYLPTKWNTRDNYASRVKNNSRYMSIAQQNKNN